MTKKNNFLNGLLENGIIRYLVLFFFFLYFLISYLQINVYNYDIWWHLATGRYIVENHSLPQDDPFCYTSSNVSLEKKRTILKGYWLAQVIFYKVYDAWDLQGIITLRSLTMLMFLLLVFLTIRKQKVSNLLSLLLILVVFRFSLYVEGERPQLFTILVFALVFYLLEDYRINRTKKIFLVPVSVALLSNMHPGYIVCILLISIYLMGEGIRHYIFKDRSDSRLRGLLIIWLLTIFFSIFNPNGPGSFLQMISSHMFTKGSTYVIEFLPTFHLYINKMIPVDYYYIAFLFFSLLSLRYFKKIGVVHVLLLLVFAFMSFVAYRYIVFFMCVAPPIIARLINCISNEKIFEKLNMITRKMSTPVNVIACITGIFLVINAMPLLLDKKSRGDYFFSIPKGAADFLSNVEIKGNMFNEYGFGGYLIWRLYPDKKVFIDSRGLVPYVTEESNVVSFAVDNPQHSWKDIIEKYGISYFILKPVRNYGDIVPIVEKLFDSEDWLLIYKDHLSLIFMKNSLENQSVINRYSMAKKEGLNTVIAQASAWALSGNQGNPRYLITIGKTFVRMGRFNDAEKALLLAEQKDPGNKEVILWLQKIREYRTKINKT